MNRTTRIGKSLTTIAGASLSLLIGSGLFAVIRDTADSSGNRVTAGEFDQIGTLQLARPGPGNTCEGVQYTPGPSFPLEVVDNLNLNTGTFTVDQANVCVRSIVGSLPNQRLLVRMANIADSEVACSNSGNAFESGVDGTCGSGAGELSQVIHMKIVRQDVAAETPLRLLGDWKVTPSRASDFVANLNGTQPVRLTLQMFMDPRATEQQRRAAQSDRVQWDVRFELDSE